MEELIKAYKEKVQADLLMDIKIFAITHGIMKVTYRQGYESISSEVSFGDMIDDFIAYEEKKERTKDGK